MRENSATPASSSSSERRSSGERDDGFRDGFGFVFRVVYFAVAPVALLALGRVVPMTAALVNMAFALVAFFFGEVLRKWIERMGWLGRLLRRQLAFESYYRQHPPKPFGYYVLYPLLFPYWLFVREARREFWLFKGYTLLTAAVVAVAGVYRLLFVYRPELGFRDFLWPFLVGLLVETLAVMIFIMPITTSVVALHMRGHRRRLIALIAIGLLSAAGTSVALARQHRTRPSLEARYRVEQRTKARPTYADQAMVTALRAAWQIKSAGTREDDGILEGPPLEAARNALQIYYREDEAETFDLWASGKKEKRAMLVLVAEGRSKTHPPLFLGMRPDGTLVRKGGELPPGARRIVRDTSPL